MSHFRLLAEDLHTSYGYSRFSINSPYIHVRLLCDIWWKSPRLSTMRLHQFMRTWSDVYIITWYILCDLSRLMGTPSDYWLEIPRPKYHYQCLLLCNLWELSWTIGWKSQVTLSHNLSVLVSIKTEKNNIANWQLYTIYIFIYFLRKKKKKKKRRYGQHSTFKVTVQRRLRTPAEPQPIFLLDQT